MRRFVRSSLVFFFLVSACTGGDPLDSRKLAVGNAVKSQLRGYDLGPPFPAGFRDSGVVNGYAEGEWVPFVAVMEGRTLEVADELDGASGNGIYRASLILPTYSPRNDANGISDLAVSGTYGEGALTPIPDPFDDGWLVEHGYAPFVLGAHSAGGEVDPEPTILSVSQRSGPTRFGGQVASVSVPIEFELPAGTDRVELLFAVRLAPPELEPVSPDGQEFPGTAAGSAQGAAGFHPGPGPIFVGYQVGKPTGIATVPIHLDRASCESSEGCAPGESCTVEDCEKIEGGAIGAPGQSLTLPSGVTVSITEWIAKGDSPGDYIGFEYETTGGAAKFRVKAGTGLHYGNSSPWEHPGGTSGPGAPGISNIVWCPDDPDGGGASGGECDDPCVDDSNCPSDQLCEDGTCEPLPPSCEGDEDCGDEVCVGGFCVPECPESCGDVEFCDPSPCQPPDGQNPPCVLDQQCDGGLVCEDGICQPPEPPCDMSCPPGEMCRDGVCEPPETPCDDDSQCPGGEVCEEGVCQPGTPPCEGSDCEPCDFDTECPGGETCEDGHCVPLNPPLPCTDAGDCPLGSDDVSPQSCEGGFCTPPDEPCGEGGECGPGEVCDVGSGVCVPEHPPIPCTDEVDCPSGDLCVGGWCTPDGGECQNDNQCGGDDVCGGGTCVPPQEPCSDDSECSSGICEGGFCVPEHPPVPCEEADQCPTGSDDVYVPSCEGGYCQPPRGCTGDEECRGGEVCEEGTCEPGQPPEPCTVDSDCPPGEDDVYLPVCIGGFCTPSDGVCVDDADCPGGDLCVDGACVAAGDPTPCTTQFDCGGGALCSGGFCEPGDGPTECETFEDCPPNPYDDVGPACVNGVCTTSRVVPEPCTDIADCSAGYACEEGVCLPVAGACEVDADCAAGACIAGWCGVACASASDCAGGETCALGRCASPCSDYGACGRYETCLEGGCVPLYVSVSGSGGDPAQWDVLLPESDETLQGGCSIGGGPGERGGAALLVLLAVAIGRLPRQKRRGRFGLRFALPLLVALLAAAGYGCTSSGEDEAAGEPDASSGGQAVAPDAGEGSGEGGASSTSPYQLVTCEAGSSSMYSEHGEAADAGPAPDAGADMSPDAGVEDGDGDEEGDGEGEDAIDSPCCDPTGRCPGDLACIEGPTDEERRCRPGCDLATRDCPEGGACADFGGRGVCLPASTEGQECAPELCDDATICVGSSAEDATCHRRCESAEDCDEGESCGPVAGASTKACL